MAKTKVDKEAIIRFLEKVIDNREVQDAMMTAMIEASNLDLIKNVFPDSDPETMDQDEAEDFMVEIAGIIVGAITDNSEIMNYIASELADVFSRIQTPDHTRPKVGEETW